MFPFSNVILNQNNNNKYTCHVYVGTTSCMNFFIAMSLPNYVRMYISTSMSLTTYVCI